MMNELSDPVKARKAERAREMAEILDDFKYNAVETLQLIGAFIGAIVGAIAILFAVFGGAVVLIKFFCGILTPLIGVPLAFITEIGLIVLIIATYNTVVKALERNGIIKER